MLCLTKHKLDFNVNKFDFQLGFLYKSDLCISTAESLKELSESNTFKSGKP